MRTIATRHGLACTGLLLVLAAGCGGARSDGLEAVDGGALDASAPPELAPTAARLSLEHVRKAVAPDARLSRRFDESAHALRLEGDRLRTAPLQGARAAQAAKSPIFAQGAPFADAPLTIGVGGFASWTTRWTLLGAAHAPAEEIDGRVVFRDALRQTDLLLASAPDGLETFALLRDETAPRTLRWKVARSAGIVASEIDERGDVVLLDAQGLAVIRVERPTALDAGGAKVPIVTTYVDDVLELKVDTTGARFPVLVDPFTGAAYWTRRRNASNQDTFKSGGSTAGCGSCTGGIGYDAMAYSQALGRVISMGGFTDAPSYQTVTTWLDWDSRNGQWLKGPGTFSPPATGRDTFPTATNAAGEVLALFGSDGGSPLGDAFVHDGANWFLLCNETASCPLGAATDCSRFAGKCLTGTAGTARDGAVAGYVGGQFVVFGGKSGAALGDTCVGSTFPLSCSTPSGSPQARAFATATVDTKRNKLVMHGGQAADWTLLDDTWEWDPSTGWAARCGAGGKPACPMTTPAVANGAAVIYDSIRGVTVFVDPGAATTWEWDGTSWSQACSSCGPTYRYGFGKAFDPNVGRVVVAGGYGAGYQVDTWEYHVRGNSCADGSTCDTGYCVDGVCCEAPLCATCQTCNAGGSPGVCTAVVSGADPDSCPTATSRCDAAGACKSNEGIACSSGATCASSYCVTSTTGKVCCSAASCSAGQICQIGTGACIGDLGYACTASSQCASGNCVDGVCCDSSCDPSKPCQSCNNAGHVGHCTVTSGAPTAGRGTCPTSASTDTACKKAICDGSDASACHYPGGTTTCSSTSKCASGTQSDPIGCNGKGDCGYSTKACNELACNAAGTACNTTCGADTDCASGYFCSGGACVVRETQGTPCTTSGQCKSGLACVDGVCCGSASCPSGTCNGSHPGTCTFNNGQSCTAATQCTSSNCFDGVCCSSACGGQCQSCAETGSVGTCKTVTGTPRNGRTACTAASGEPTCGPRTCDGSNPVACTAPTGATSCGAATCASGTASFAGKCDGSGACVTPPTLTCAPYVCGASACKSSCAADADCITGYWCSGTMCVQKLASGLSCTGASQCQSGACVDGVCCASASCGGAAKCNLPGFKGACMIAQGNACTAASASQCTTGFCADGVCCNAACAGTCEACDGGGGVCAAVLGAPHAGHGTCTNATGGDPACATATCNGALRSACSLPSGNTCGGGCSAGMATTTGSCDGTGACAGSSKVACAPYVCGASACKTTCASAADCASGNYCDATGHCVALLATGTTCSANAQCASAHCVDGVCCGSASCPTGGVCNDASHLGACVIQQGKACVAGTPCATGNCVDGYCCNSTCAGQCEACDVSGLLGICSPVPAKGLPHGGRAACTNTGTDPTCSVASCDGSTRATCMLPTSATPCGSNSCSGGVFTSAGTCSGGGACKPNVNGGCSPYVCGATACKTTCASDADCSGGFFCDTATHLCQGLAALGKPCTTPTACGSKLYCNLADSVCCESSTCPNGTCNGARPGHCTLNNGQACTTGSQCTSGNCVDGVCCNTSCTGNCESCDVDAAHAGVCTPVVGAPIGGRALCASDATKCGTKVCNGVDTKQCNYPTSSTACGAQTCASGTETDPGSCDGGGKCSATTRACGSFQCGATACKTTCTSDADCVSTAFCDASGSCQPRGAAGRPCDASQPNACGDGLGCQDGVCCADPQCNAHNGFCAGSHPGVCKLVNDGACAKDDDCNSGHCVEIDAGTGKGICCDTKCDGVCETCQDKGAPGTCVPVRGAPATGHGSCPAGSGDLCSGAVCDGKGRASCDGKPGKETVCQPATCDAGKANVDIACDGSGACPKVPLTFCDNFRTCASATACAQGACTKDDDCVSGYACEVATGKCRQKAAHCKTDDPTVAVDAFGNEQSCAPFLCDTDGTCKKTCNSSNDCAGGYACDDGTGKCAPLQGNGSNDTNSGGGCDLAAPAGEGHAAWAIVALIGLAIAGRGRRRAASRTAARAATEEGAP